MKRCRMVVAASALVAACATAPKDPFQAASRAIERADLVGALMAYDAVPVTHPRYPEARAAAGDVEQRMRRSLELELEALMLRGEWRDHEALDALRRARDIWRELPGLDQLVVATERRLALLEHGADLAADVVAEPPAVPLLEGARLVPAPTVVVASPPSQTSVALPVLAPTSVASLAPETVAQEPPANGLAPADRPVRTQAPPAIPAGPGASAPVTDPASAPSRTVTSSAASGSAVPATPDPVGPALIEAENRLMRGDIDLAVADLIELARAWPEDARVRLRLMRLLHQRALRRYGEGTVAAAINDWERILALDPADPAALQALAVARSETHQWR